ncbi:S-adenosylmethionine:tRNA ribosyltransferase-isomerase [Halosquirtibacter xylanolyticus]|uniref:S-adenosylmethionine:tRNA ribosyltransferase-isomerase n=1 Tax=Halosquirtibacter xylanolyticus TaxID=3374599 RepID=UPI00374869EA|nr:S-adenosylmethionine:tRNA ribosyltransferase-isomerase [Prolixibacteraceae bacterium]
MTKNLGVQEISMDQYNYPLPDERIAKYPLSNRSDSMLMFFQDGKMEDRMFKDVADLVPRGSLLVFNNTRVIRARLYFHKSTGAKIEIFCLEPLKPIDYLQSFGETEHCTWKCIVGNAKKWKDGVLTLPVIMADGKEVSLQAEKGEMVGNAREIVFSWNHGYTFSEVLEASGNIPIPPYLHRDTEDSDLQTYQTVYSKIKGSVAAPTAGLHFTEKIIDRLHHAGVDTDEVTLHVGAGTFQPVKSETIGGHEMHTEKIEVSKIFLKNLLAHIKSVIAVGTTSIRTLESLYWMGVKVQQNITLPLEDLHVQQWEPYQELEYVSTEDAISSLILWMERNRLDEIRTSTQIIIAPGYKYRVIRGMFTNFHQPQSTLLLLISAFLGEKWREIYQHALDNNYRFLSYGDSNLYLK